MRVCVHPEDKLRLACFRLACTIHLKVWPVPARNLVSLTYEITPSLAP